MNDKHPIQFGSMVIDGIVCAAIAIPERREYAVMVDGQGRNYKGENTPTFTVLSPEAFVSRFGNVFGDAIYYDTNTDAWYVWSSVGNIFNLS